MHDSSGCAAVAAVSFASRQNVPPTRTFNAALVYFVCVTDVSHRHSIPVECGTSCLLLGVPHDNGVLESCRVGRAIFYLTRMWKVRRFESR